MDKAAKEVLVGEYNDIFKSAVSGVLVDYKGVTVEELTAPRKALYAQKSKLRVLKNTLAKRGAQGTACEGLAEHFVQTRAFVYSDEDIAAPAKIIIDEAKNNEKLAPIAGVLVSGDTGELLDVDGIKQLSNMPSKETLLVQLLYVMNAPITNFVRTINEVPSSFVRTIQAISDSKN